MDVGTVDVVDVGDGMMDVEEVVIVVNDDEVVAATVMVGVQVGV